MTPILIPAGNPSEWTGPTGQQHLAAARAASRRSSTPASATRSTRGGRGARLTARRSSRVLITHWHPDHVKGLPALRDRWPGSMVVDAAGDAVPAGDGTLEIIPTPGHAPDHLCFFDREAGDLYCGDLARSGGTIVIPARKGGRPARLPRVAAADARARAAAAAAGPRADRRRPDRADRRIHRAPAEARAADPAGDARRARGRWTRSSGASIPRCPRRSATRAADSVRAHLAKLRDEGRA